MNYTRLIAFFVFSTALACAQWKETTTGDLKVISATTKDALIILIAVPVATLQSCNIQSFQVIAHIQEPDGSPRRSVTVSVPTPRCSSIPVVVSIHLRDNEVPENFQVIEQINTIDHSIVLP